MTPWRNIIHPSDDVKEHRFDASSFAIDLSLVRSGKAKQQTYLDAQSFFEHTFLTRGLRELIATVVSRWNGVGGEPVIQMQTGFGGGKTHSLLALYHLATCKCSVRDLAGIEELLQERGLEPPKQAQVVVLDGTHLSPSKPVVHGDIEARTLWGEWAWQMGGDAAYRLMEQNDRDRTPPTIDLISEIMGAHLPCITLMDEIAMYYGAAMNKKGLMGGTAASIRSFMQNLSTAMGQNDRSVLVSILPVSTSEAGDAQGTEAFDALKTTLGRVNSIWTPTDREDSFEIVRRQLFKQDYDKDQVRAICRAYCDMYRQERDRLPPKAVDDRYFERMCKAYPFHPEIIDQLYDQWSTLSGFQQTRGVLRWLADFVHQLWRDNNQDPLIQPSMLPLQSGSPIRNEMLNLLPKGFDAVIDSDIAGHGSRAHEIERQNERFEVPHSALAMAKALFFCTAPLCSTVTTRNLEISKKGVGLDLLLLCCLTPAVSASLYADVMPKLNEKLSYIYRRGQEGDRNAIYYFDVRINIRREAENRQGKYRDEVEIQEELFNQFKKAIGQGPKSKSGELLFDKINCFVQPSQVADNTDLQLVVLPPSQPFGDTSDEQTIAVIKPYIETFGDRPRVYQNRLVFLGVTRPDGNAINDYLRKYLAWMEVCQAIEKGELNVDTYSRDQAKEEAEKAKKQVMNAIKRNYTRICVLSKGDFSSKTYRCDCRDPYDEQTKTFAEAIQKAFEAASLIYMRYTPSSLEQEFDNQYVDTGHRWYSAERLCSDYMRYVNLPKLRNADVLKSCIERCIREGQAIGAAYGDAGEQPDNVILQQDSLEWTDDLLIVERNLAEEIDEERRRLQDEAVAKAQIAEAVRQATLSQGLTAEETDPGFLKSEKTLPGTSLDAPPEPRATRLPTPQKAAAPETEADEAVEPGASITLSRDGASVQDFEINGLTELAKALKTLNSGQYTVRMDVEFRITCHQGMSAEAFNTIKETAQRFEYHTTKE